MTKEKLEKEAEDYADNQIGCGDGYYEWTDVEEAYLAGAEPREKQIEIDAEQIRALQKQNGELTDKVKELEEEVADLQLGISIRNEDMEKLEAQIEKMQNCRNCKNEKIEGACGHFTQVGWCIDWELAD